jgi:hypothetical protein
MGPGSRCKQTTTLFYFDADVGATGQVGFGEARDGKRAVGSDTHTSKYDTTNKHNAQDNSYEQPQVKSGHSFDKVHACQYPNCHQSHPSFTQWPTTPGTALCVWRIIFSAAMRQFKFHYATTSLDPILQNHLYDATPINPWP